jgi:hypothetical protein
MHYAILDGHGLLIWYAHITSIGQVGERTSRGVSYEEDIKELGLTVVRVEAFV